MIEPTAEGPSAVEKKTALKAKRTGQTCITLFVVFVIVLLAFGKQPFVKVDGPKGFAINYDFISCLGNLALCVISECRGYGCAKGSTRSRLCRRNSETFFDRRLSHDGSHLLEILARVKNNLL